MRTNELMLYKNMEYGEILKDITFLIDHYESEYYNREDLRALLFDCINELLELSVSHGFEGNLWHTYLTFLLASDENAYSTSCEIVGEVKGVSMRLHCMILKYLRNYLTMISVRWKKVWMQNVCRSFWIIRNVMSAGRFLTAGYGIGSAL